MCSQSKKECQTFTIKNNADVLKTSIFLESKFEEMPQLWKAKRYKVYSGKRLFWHYHLQLLFFCKTVSQISFNLFCSGDKRLFLSKFLWRLGWFYEHNQRFPEYRGGKLWKQIMPFKTKVNWLFTDIWCYLVIGCFGWNIVVFQ